MNTSDFRVSWSSRIRRVSQLDFRHWRIGDVVDSVISHGVLQAELCRSGLCREEILEETNKKNVLQ